MRAPEPARSSPVLQGDAIPSLRRRCPFVLVAIVTGALAGDLKRWPPTPPSLPWEPALITAFQYLVLLTVLVLVLSVAVRWFVGRTTFAHQDSSPDGFALLLAAALGLGYLLGASLTFSPLRLVLGL